jgi:zinc transport system substrate-binding protein
LKYLLLLLTVVACTTSAHDARSIVASIEPVRFLVSEIVGDQTQVKLLLPPDRSPATYELTPHQMTELSQASILFTIGVPFENSLVAKLDNMTTDARLVDCTDGITLLPISGHEGHDHDHGMLDPHVWLSPILAKQIAQTIADELVALYPDHAEKYARNLASLQLRLDSVDTEIRAILSEYDGRSFYIYHPSFGYFAREYGLIQKPVEVEGKEPSARQLAQLIDRMKADPVTVLFVQPQFASPAVERLADELDATVVEIDPMAVDYLDNLITVANRIAAALGSK